jgi:hypothetical protein
VSAPSDEQVIAWALYGRLRKRLYLPALSLGVAIGSSRDIQVLALSFGNRIFSGSLILKELAVGESGEKALGGGLQLLGCERVS